jgi:hypothetical protein
MPAVADTLLLDGEFGHAELVQDLEASFGVHLPPPEIQTWYFVGDIYRSLVLRLGPATEGGTANAAILAFYYLRRGIRALGREIDLTPATPLWQLERFQVRRFLKLLAAETGLKMPEADGSWIGWAAIIGCLIAAAGWLFGIPPFPIAWPYALLALCMSAFLPLFDPGRFPSDCKTVGQFAEKVAGLNYAKLRGDGAAGDATAIWKALLAVLKEHAEEPDTEITPNTRLITPQIGN